jgi:hypothetical protein
MAAPSPEKLVEVAMQQLHTSYEFKRPRIEKIARYRKLYNADRARQLRQTFNVPLPVFAGMIDTLQADLNDKLLIEYNYTDPADWKTAEKATAAIRKESESSRPNAQWQKKFRQYRFEKIMSGRGILHFSAENGSGYSSALDVVPFEDFFFEPMGGGSLENHIFCGRQNIWRTKGQMKRLAKEGIYNTAQVAKLVGSDFKRAGFWDPHHDLGERFRPLGLNTESHNYVGEEVYHLCEWVLEFAGRRWYLVFDPYSGEWVRCERNEDVSSADLLPFISSASHEDLKNFASKAFTDDLYPVADSVITLFNQDMTARQKKLFGPRAYDKEMFKNVAKLDEAQSRPDALVPVDTFNGTRRIAEGIYEFKTPDFSGTIDAIEWLQRDTGKHLGVTEAQQGAVQSATKKVGVMYGEMAQISKRLEFTSEPFREMGQQLGDRFFVSLGDYMTEPLPIKLYGERGIEWDVFKRAELDVKKDLEVTVSSELSRNNANNAKKQNRIRALEMTAQSPNINARVREEMILRDVGEFDEHDIALLMDPTADTDRETLAEAAAAIQAIVIHGKKPKTNHNADLYFVKRLHEFAKRHQDTLSDKKFKMLMAYANEHLPIAQGNVPGAAKQQAQRDGALMRQKTLVEGPVEEEAAAPVIPGMPTVNA